ncbi:hypothetical protein F4778DRAFT_438322 [Xylariomycetidae sp. FL2044]|nr:hypothetical protein F4778DRAFT_438322 [Xylariomycetidae sp. FL2044]
MPPRRSHKKSRAGCRRCKARKIKALSQCDEVHPRCGNCSKHGVPCDFEHPNLRDSLAPPDTPRPTTSPSGGGDSPSSSTLPPTPSLPSSTPAPIYRAPDPAPLFGSSQKNRMMELRLLHHYTTVTCKTLAISSQDVSEKLWRETVPNLAFSGNNFLADALLAVAALHLRYISPHDQDIVRASHAYMASTLSEYGASLKRGITESNAEALFLTAALIAFQSTASRMFNRDDSGEMKDRISGYTLPLSWFHSFQGVKAVVANSWQWLRNSTVVVPIIESQPALNLDLSGGHATFFGDLLAGSEEEIAADQDPANEALTRQAYQHAVAVLDWAHKIPHTGAPLVFLATVSKRFVELLEARRPRALAILASYFGLLKCLDHVWWLKGVARREIMGIVSLFNPDDEVWWPRLKWPLRIALFEGSDIPADVWGADWLVEKQRRDESSQNGGFVSHIELLSKMFSAVQNMSVTTLPDALDFIAHEDAVAKEKALQRQMILQNALHVPQVD